MFLVSKVFCCLAQPLSLIFLLLVLSYMSGGAGFQRLRRILFRARCDPFVFDAVNQLRAA